MVKMKSTKSTTRSVMSFWFKEPTTIKSAKPSRRKIWREKMRQIKSQKLRTIVKLKCPTISILA